MALGIIVLLEATLRGDVIKYAFIRVATSLKYNPIGAKSGVKNVLLLPPGSNREYLTYMNLKDARDRSITRVVTSSCTRRLAYIR